jgi:hypothetical protein
MADGSTRPRCATCRHWLPNDGWNDLWQPFGDEYGELPSLEESDPERWAQIEQHNRESGICGKVRQAWGEDDKSKPLPLATCMDGSHYKAELHTHRTFGCVLHEPKEAE